MRPRFSVARCCCQPAPSGLLVYGGSAVLEIIDDGGTRSINNESVEVPPGGLNFFRRRMGVEGSSGKLFFLTYKNLTYDSFGSTVPQPPDMIPANWTSAAIRFDSNPQVLQVTNNDGSTLRQVKWGSTTDPLLRTAADFYTDQPTQTTNEGSIASAQFPTQGFAHSRSLTDFDATALIQELEADTDWINEPDKPGEWANKFEVEIQGNWEAGWYALSVVYTYGIALTFIVP